MTFNGNCGFGKTDEKFPATAFVLNPPYSASGNGMIFVEKALAMTNKSYAAIIIQNSAGSGKAMDKIIDGTEYDYVTRTSLNRGILCTTGFVNSENINSAVTWSLGLLQMDFFYREKPWHAGQFVRKIIPKIDK